MQITGPELASLITAFVSLATAAAAWLKGHTAHQAAKGAQRDASRALARTAPPQAPAVRPPDQGYMR